MRCDESVNKSKYAKIKYGANNNTNRYWSKVRKEVTEKRKNINVPESSNQKGNKNE